MTAKTTEGDSVNIKIHPVVLATIVTCLITFLGFSGWLIRTVGHVQDVVDSTKTDIELQQAYVVAETNRVNFMVGLLTKDQQGQLMQYDLAHPMPPLHKQRPRREPPKEN